MKQLILKKYVHELTVLGDLPISIKNWNLSSLTEKVVASKPTFNLVRG